MMKHSSLSIMVSIIGAVLSLPLLADLAFGISGAATSMFMVIIICWFASLLIGIGNVIRASKSRQHVRLAIVCALVPVVFFVLSWLPIWPQFMIWVHEES